MATLKKISFYQLFPILSIICLFSAKLYEANYPYRNPSRIVDYALFNLLYQGALFFLIAYLIPLFVSLKAGKNTKRILIMSSLFLVVFYLLISSYFFFFKTDATFLANNYDLFLGALGGILLGSAHASSYNENDHSYTPKITE